MLAAVEDLAGHQVGRNVEDPGGFELARHGVGDGGTVGGGPGAAPGRIDRVGMEKIDPRGRAEFLGLAARAMRSVLVDHARKRTAQKRGGGQERVPLDSVVELYEERAVDLAGLDEALDKLQAYDPELARLVELRFFGGLGIQEVADTLGFSRATADRRWRMARIFLASELERLVRVGGTLELPDEAGRRLVYVTAIDGALLDRSTPREIAIELASWLAWQIHQIARVRAASADCEAWDDRGRPLRIEQI